MKKIPENLTRLYSSDSGEKISLIEAHEISCDSQAEAFKEQVIKHSCGATGLFQFNKEVIFENAQRRAGTYTEIPDRPTLITTEVASTAFKEVFRSPVERKRTKIFRNHGQENSFHSSQKLYAAFMEEQAVKRHKTIKTFIWQARSA